ncbi:GMP synthase (glutamine-hydrolyzing) [Bradyrhizobium japonicum]|uniref:glutamine amidotransferase n=1 Tax=Bradyrhizobium japonicum TaxID=375 RepID=UPI0021695A43|nr:glutamine amidotransferase [Bradyrhizobium japonicum]MCS3501982.1 GMP synthase (glutamine-hydrolyzing) [Bradyrhizobium japonicum]MCS3965304.1 GMP synthase (glutamine-hydrolyzing) [Bradyrhizobium japonicum]MCS3997611.1 GMP synthase (glutamine-hydrolyzing) [Bradyrhizobium japonicum]
MFQRRRSAVALRHVAFEDLGLLAPIMEREGWNVSFCEAPVDDLSHSSIGDADLLIVLGGPIGVYETERYPFLTREIDLLERRLAQGLPTLGICLGAQLMAKALGARIYAGGVKEIGWGSVTLTDAGQASSLKPLAESAPVLHWHGDTFDLPDNAARLASNENYENQAFAFGNNALALQFYLEADPRQLEEWYVGHAVELASAKISVQELRARTAEVSKTVARAADRVFTTWLGQLGQGNAAGKTAQAR